MSIYDLTVTNVDGEPFALEQFKGKARLPPTIFSLSPLWPSSNSYFDL